MKTATATVAPKDLKGNEFEVTLNTSPEVWSSCVGADAKVPAIIIKTSITLKGAKTSAGSVLGGEKTDLKKALALHFQPAWRPCALA